MVTKHHAVSGLSRNFTVLEDGNSKIMLADSAPDERSLPGFLQMENVSWSAPQHTCVYEDRDLSLPLLLKPLIP